MENLKKQYRDLEMRVRRLLRGLVEDSIIPSTNFNSTAISVNVFDYKELIILDGRLQFVDSQDNLFNLFTDCNLEDLIDIINENRLGVETYILSSGQINDVILSEKIQLEELHEYEIRNRVDFIDSIMGWIPEATESDRYLMRQDLELLMSLPDAYILSSNRTNDYIYESHKDFETTCKELLELNESLES